MKQSSEFRRSLCETMYELQQAGILCDIQVDITDSEAPIDLHSIVLAGSCPKFRQELMCDDIEPGMSSFTVLGNLENDSLKELVRYLYTGVIDLDRCNMDKLRLCCEELQLSEAVKQIQNYGQECDSPMYISVSTQTTESTQCQLPLNTTQAPQTGEICQEQDTTSLEVSVMDKIKSQNAEFDLGKREVLEQSTDTPKFIQPNRETCKLQSEEKNGYQSLPKESYTEKMKPLEPSTDTDNLMLSDILSDVIDNESNDECEISDMKSTEAEKENDILSVKGVIKDERVIHPGVTTDSAKKSVATLIPIDSDELTPTETRDADIEENIPTTSQYDDESQEYLSAKSPKNKSGKTNGEISVTVSPQTDDNELVIEIHEVNLLPEEARSLCSGRTAIEAQDNNSQIPVIANSNITSEEINLNPIEVSQPIVSEKSSLIPMEGTSQLLAEVSNLLPAETTSPKVVSTSHKCSKKFTHIRPKQKDFLLDQGPKNRVVKKSHHKIPCIKTSRTKSKEKVSLISPRVVLHRLNAEDMAKYGVNLIECPTLVDNKTSSPKSGCAQSNGSHILECKGNHDKYHGDYNCNVKCVDPQCNNDGGQDNSLLECRRCEHNIEYVPTDATPVKGYTVGNKKHSGTDSIKDDDDKSFETSCVMGRRTIPRRNRRKPKRLNDMYQYEDDQTFNSSDSDDENTVNAKIQRSDARNFSFNLRDIGANDNNTDIVGEVIESSGVPIVPIDNKEGSVTIQLSSGKPSTGPRKKRSKSSLLAMFSRSKRAIMADSDSTDNEDIAQHKPMWRHVKRYRQSPVKGSQVAGAAQAVVHNSFVKRELTVFEEIQENKLHPPSDCVDLTVLSESDDKSILGETSNINDNNVKKDREKLNSVKLPKLDVIRAKLKCSKIIVKGSTDKVNSPTSHVEHNYAVPSKESEKEDNSKILKAKNKLINIMKKASEEMRNRKINVKTVSSTSVAEKRSTETRENGGESNWIQRVSKPATINCDMRNSISSNRASIWGIVTSQGTNYKSITEEDKDLSNIYPLSIGKSDKGIVKETSTEPKDGNSDKTDKKNTESDENKSEGNDGEKDGNTDERNGDNGSDSNQDDHGDSDGNNGDSGGSNGENDGNSGDSGGNSEDSGGNSGDSGENNENSGENNDQNNSGNDGNNDKNDDNEGNTQDEGEDEGNNCDEDESGENRDKIDTNQGESDDDLKETNMCAISDDTSVGQITEDNPHDNIDCSDIEMSRPDVNHHGGNESMTELSKTEDEENDDGSEFDVKNRKKGKTRTLKERGGGDNKKTDHSTRSSSKKAAANSMLEERRSRKDKYSRSSGYDSAGTRSESHDYSSGTDSRRSVKRPARFSDGFISDTKVKGRRLSLTNSPPRNKKQKYNTDSGGSSKEKAKAKMKHTGRRPKKPIIEYIIINRFRSYNMIHFNNIMFNLPDVKVKDIKRDPVLKDAVKGHPETFKLNTEFINSLPPLTKPKSPNKEEEIDVETPKPKKRGRPKSLAGKPVSKPYKSAAAIAKPYKSAATIAKLNKSAAAKVGRPSNKIFKPKKEKEAEIIQTNLGGDDFEVGLRLIVDLNYSLPKAAQVAQVEPSLLKKYVKDQQKAGTVNRIVFRDRKYDKSMKYYCKCGELYHTINSLLQHCDDNVCDFGGDAVFKKCGKCRLPTWDDETFLEHQEEEHWVSRIIQKCNYCDYEVRNNKLMVYHMKYEHDIPMSEQKKNEIYKCTGKDCDYETCYDISLTHHQKAHREQRFPCMRCDEILESYYDWLAHRRMHKGVVSSRCTECSEVFTDTGLWKEHVVFVHGSTITASVTKISPEDNEENESPNDMAFVCEHCPDFHTKSKHILAVHKFTYHRTGNEGMFRSVDQENQGQVKVKVIPKDNTSSPYSCDICGHFSGSSAVTLAIHKYREHAEDFDCKKYQVYPCAYCTFSSQNASVSKNHVESHVGLTHKCKYCHRGFYTQEEFTQHQQQHIRGKKLSCMYEWCRFTCALEDNMEKHLLVKHPQQWETDDGTDPLATDSDDIVGQMAMDVLGDIIGTPKPQPVTTPTRARKPKKSRFFPKRYKNKKFQKPNPNRMLSALDKDKTEDKESSLFSTWDTLLTNSGNKTPEIETPSKYMFNSCGQDNDNQDDDDKLFPSLENEFDDNFSMEVSERNDNEAAGEEDGIIQRIMDLNKDIYEMGGNVSDIGENITADSEQTRLDNSVTTTTTTTVGDIGVCSIDINDFDAGQIQLLPEDTSNVIHIDSKADLQQLSLTSGMEWTPVHELTNQVSSSTQMFVLSDDDQPVVTTEDFLLS